MLKRLATVFAFVAVISGCQTQSPYPMGDFPEGEYSSLKRVGTGTVTGQAFLTTRSGDVKYSAGKKVSLIPKTSYSADYIHAYLLGKKLKGISPKFHEYTLNTQADASGRFVFKKVPSGDYYIVSRIVWEYIQGNIRMPAGGDVMKEISVTGGETIDVILTK